MDVLEIQKLLNRHGFNPGEIDGVWGRRTMKAVKAFQTAHGLKPDGIVGPLTSRALAGTLGAAITPSQEFESGPLVWYEEALNLVGTKEGEGYRNNPDILVWAKDLKIDYKGDDIPWCGLFVAHCVGATLPDEQLPAHPLRARAWERFGEPSPPKRGAVLVFWRGSKASGNGHVGFYHGEDAQSYHVLGGNQSNAVNIARISKGRLLAVRWPRTAATLTSDAVIAEARGPMSDNEA